MKIDSISMDSADCGVFAPEVAVLPLLERHAVQVLLAAGHGPAEVAELRKVAARTVHRIAKESAVVHVDDAAERRSRRVGRPSQLEAFRKLVADTLAAEPLLPSVGVLHRVRAAGYRGGKSALYAMVALARPKPPGVMMRFEAVPGEFSQHDFGQVLVRYLGGKVERVRFFASRLKYSRYAQVSLVPDETTETLVRAWAEHLAAFGGVPLLCVFDRPRTIADRWRKDGTVTHWNAAFAQAALDLGVGVGAGFCAAEGVELCWPRRPNHKGSDENLVGWVKGSFFKVRRFVDRDDLQLQLAAWHREANDERPSRATGVTPASRLADERARLQTLRTAPADLALRIPVHVGPTAEVTHKTNRDTMPPEAAGHPATLWLYRDRVRIVTGDSRFEATHHRLTGRNQAAATPELRAARLAQVPGRRGRLYRMRQDLIELGADALETVTEIVHRRPQQMPREVERLHAALQLHGPDAMCEAFAATRARKQWGAEYVDHHLLAQLGERTAQRLPETTSGNSGANAQLPLFRPAQGPEVATA